MPKPKISPADLPQYSETWYYAFRKLRIWITPADKPPHRPYAAIVVDLKSESIINFSLTQKIPSPKDAESLLRKSMLQPLEGSEFNPHRPRQVHFENGVLNKALTPALQILGIECRHRPQHASLDHIFHPMEDHMRGREEAEGLLKQKGVTVRQVECLFQAAAEYFQAEPWVELSDEDVLSIRLPSMKAPYYGIVMGQAGIAYGLVMRKTWKDVLKSYLQDDDPMRSLPADGENSLFFDDITLLPFDDLEAVERYGWPIAAKNAYPVAIIVQPDRDPSLSRPDRDMLLWYEAALRAIPIFVRQNLKVGADAKFLSCEVDIPVTLSNGNTSVHITFPAGEIPKSLSIDLPIEDGQGELPFDRRAMEGILAEHIRGLETTPLVSKDVQKAQELMYEAWKLDNTARRIALAQQALKVSPDCADAYVLLAEELADSPRRALSYYENAIAAGRRALGKDFFQNQAGNFWMIMETRPFMRALEGKAGILWKLGQSAEAHDTYREMLRLNPGDNQGMRYLLLELLLEMGQDAKAVQLLKEYKDDYSSSFFYTKALLEYRKNSDKTSATRSLQKALKQNPHVPEYLTAKIRIPASLPQTIGFGDVNEAVVYAARHLNSWRRTPGALDWLKSQLE
jgi:tetratricopeptide (TPR) repeat protein